MPVAKFPEPPSPQELAARTPAFIHSLPEGTEVWRVYFAGGPYPARWSEFRAFGPTGSRFDHHLPPPRVQSRKILYGADEALTCVAEVFQGTRTINRWRKSPMLVSFELIGDLKLLDVAGLWSTAAGASTVLSSGFHSRARRWSRVIYEAYPEVQGICYGSSMAAYRPALALYERAEMAIPASPKFHRALADADMDGTLGWIVNEIRYRLL